MTIPFEARALEALLRKDFRAFVHKVFATLSPAQPRRTIFTLGTSRR